MLSEAQTTEIEADRNRVVQSLSRLGSAASSLYLIVAQPNLVSSGLSNLGFLDVQTCVDLRLLRGEENMFPPSTSGVVIINSGTDFTYVKDACNALDARPSKPAVIAVLVMPEEEQTESEEEQLDDVRASLLEAGADDVFSLFGQESICPHRLHEAIQRTQVLEQKARAMIDQGVENIKAQASHTLQVAWKKSMWDMPGKVLRNIPCMDTTIQERCHHEDKGIGVYSFTGQLGAGTFGAVFKAADPNYGTVAVKVISKASIRNVSQLVSIDNELCIMSNLVAHPNIIRSHRALHAESSILLIMDYGGDMNLHNFIVKKIEGSGGAMLPADKVQAYCGQEAEAVRYLHSVMVCHRDIKPANFVVSNDGSSLRLTDFGLATLVCSSEQPLTHCCGSLPFVAPEVLKQQRDSGYQVTFYYGMAADVWSLGANFVELICGLYSMERLLGWVPKQPKNIKQRLADLERIETIWDDKVDIALPHWHGLIANMLSLQVAKRWCMQQVVGSEGLSSEIITSSGPGE